MTSLAALLALPVTALVVWMLLRSSRAVALFGADPREDRWHTTRTPVFGGVGIFTGFALAALVGLAIGDGSRGEVAAVVTGALIVFGFGLLDDLRHLPPVAKLGAQVVAAVVVLSSGISVEVVDNRALQWVLGILWIVGMTNAFNLLDNMDGLAASLALVAGGCFAIAAAAVSPNEDVVLLAAALAFAAVGFLPWNFFRRPAAVFMGDSGSQVLGLVLASAGLMASYKVAGTTVATVMLPLLVLAVPIFDTALVTVMRVAEGRSVAQGGRDHTSHRLVYAGLTERRAVVLLVAVSAGLGLTSLAYEVLDSARITAIGVLLTFAALVELAMLLADATEETPRKHPLGRHARVLGEIVVDGALITASFYAAYLAVIVGNGTENQRHVFIVSLPILLAVRYVALLAVGLYRPSRARAGTREAVLVVLAVAVSTAVAYLVTRLTLDLHDFPARIYLLDAAFCAVLVVLGRLGERGLMALIRFARAPRTAIRNRARPNAR